MKLGLAVALLMILAGSAAAAKPRPGARIELPAVVIGNPRTIAYAPGLVGGTLMNRLANGDIVVPVDRYEGSKLAESFVMISANAGKTWRKQPSAWTGGVIGQLRDGTILALPVRSDGPPKQPGLYTYSALRGKDTWQSLKPETETMKVPAVEGTGDDLRAFYGMIPWNTLVEMPNGDLLMTAYGYFKGDDVPIDVSFEVYRPKPYPYPGFNKYRSILLKSADQGRTWDYVTTVAYDPSSGEEGPCEPSLVRLLNGDLLCIMRTGRVNALRLSRSRDGGRTWSRLKVIPGTTGVAPYVVEMSDGTVACIYGTKEDYWKYENRRELRVIFSFDGGKTWPLNQIVYAGEASSYASLCEVRPGELLACFSSSGLLTPEGVEQPSYVSVAPIQLKPRPQYQWP